MATEPQPGGITMMRDEKPGLWGSHQKHVLVADTFLR